MAIDSRSKRASAVGLALGFTLLAPALPDGTIAQADRQHSAWSYSGITSAAILAATADTIIKVRADDVVVRVRADDLVIET